MKPPARRRRPIVKGVLWGLVALVVVLAAGAYTWREEILRSTLDPKQPYQTYRAPAAPDYARTSSWAILPTDPQHARPGDPPVDVFFVHPTSYDGGKDWNAPLDDPQANRFLTRVVLPNYAGPFRQVGRVFAPRYRHASLFAYMTLRDDARDARRFAYGDVLAAFQAYIHRFDSGRPLILAGVGQGGKLLSRLVDEVVRTDPALARRVVAVYLIDVAVAADDYPPSGPLGACQRPEQTNCVVAWSPVRVGDETTARRILGRALVWNADGQLVNLNGRAALCVNPLTGRRDGALAPDRLNRGAADASGLEWGVRPALLSHQVSTQCQGGLLRVSRPRSASLQPRGSWADRRKVSAFNLFWLDTEADAEARVDAFLGRRVYGPAAPPIEASVEVRGAPIHRID